jgi:hypothetical protein
MFKARRRAIFFGGILVAFPLFADSTTEVPTQPLQNTDSHSLEPQKAYGKLPVHFEINEGQTDPRVRYLSRTDSYQLFLEATAATMKLRCQSANKSNVDEKHANRKSKRAVEAEKHIAIRMQLIGANAAAKVEGLDKQPGVSNYLIGKDKSKWRHGVAHYSKVKISSVYPGIDLIYYGKQRQIEHDFVISPGASPNKIRFSLEGAKKLSIDPKGNLLITLPDGGNVQLSNPHIYQVIKNKEATIKGGYVLHGKNQVGFKLAAYNKAHTLTIDPEIIYSTFLGGTNSNTVNAIAVDANGNAFVTGATTSSNFPTTEGPAYNGDQDAFVTKLNPSGTALIYSTYLGGSADDGGDSIAIDALGQAYVVGGTTSVNFPTNNAYQSTKPTASTEDSDAFLTVLDPSGLFILYSTYFGGTGDDSAIGIALYKNGLVYIAGQTLSVDLPSTLGAYQTTSGGNADGFVAEFDTVSVGGPSSLIFSTYLGGSNDDMLLGIDIDGSGSPYVVGNTTSANYPITPNAFQSTLNGGNDILVTRLNSTGNLLLYSTYFGGSNVDFGFAIDVTSPSHVYITGFTASSDFVTSPGAFQPSFGGSSDAFAVQLNCLASGASSLVYSTYLGGSGDDDGAAIRIDSSGGAIIAGNTTSFDFPTTPDSFTPSGSEDLFILRLNVPGTSLSYSTYFGGDNFDEVFGVDVDRNGNVYVVGQTFSFDGSFPITPGAFQTFFPESFNQGFVSKLSGTAPVNHALLYAVTPQAGSHGPFYDPVQVQDRFSTQTVSIKQPLHFGIPIEKFDFVLDEIFPIRDQNLHFVSYRTTGGSGTHLITAADQFGSLKLILQTGNTLLVPAYELAPNKDSKTISLQVKPHYRCYDLNAKLSANNGIIGTDGSFIDPPVVGLAENELTSTEDLTTIVRPRWYCVASKVTSDGFYDADITSTTNNYLCYDAQVQSNPIPPQFNVKTLDQFGPGVFKTVNTNLLCVPSTITSTSF